VLLFFSALPFSLASKSQRSSTLVTLRTCKYPDLQRPVLRYVRPFRESLCIFRWVVSCARSRLHTVTEDQADNEPSWRSVLGFWKIRLYLGPQCKSAKRPSQGVRLAFSTRVPICSTIPIARSPGKNAPVSTIARLAPPPSTERTFPAAKHITPSGFFFPLVLCSVPRNSHASCISPPWMA